MFSCAEWLPQCRIVSDARSIFFVIGEEQVMGKGLFHIKNVDRLRAETCNLAYNTLTFELKYCNPIAIPRVILFCLSNESMARAILGANSTLSAVPWLPDSMNSTCILS